MSSGTPASRFAETLLAGPRGRRFLLEYALASELVRDPVRAEGTFGYAAVNASFRLLAGKESTSTFFGWGASDAQLSEVTPAEVTERLNALELLEPTPELLRSALASAVDAARYWEAPDGEDLLAATPEMQLGLQRVASHVAASPFTAWWRTPTAISAQQSVQWEDASPRRAVVGDVRATVRAARNREQAAEHAARRKRAADPAANWSGDWWSRPPEALPSSARLLFDGSPARLWFVEDSLGWECAEGVRLIVPEGASVFEIRGAADWAELCVRFPLEVTAQKRDDWYRATARTARWVIPDWAQVAEHYDGVHLQVGAYLAAAGVAIPVDGSPGVASVIAGWNPDETYWFSSDIVYDNEYIRWMLEDDGVDMVWKPEQIRKPRQDG
ncbi:hypothetical protein [Microbacterium sp.]|uniref:hypothetical protein n=1 Tax=Microbacterium sp. TaxID=51671 RepID=UPI003F9698FC